jgi:Leucine-rich repeat (LRR) protein
MGIDPNDPEVTIQVDTDGFAYSFAVHNRFRFNPHSILDPSRLDNIRQLPHLLDVSFVKTPLAKVPPAVFNLPDLTSLSLVDTGISSLPAEIHTIPHLDFLNVQGNSITKIPSGLMGMESLQSLYMGNNPLKSLPSVFPPNLQFLGLGKLYHCDLNAPHEMLDLKDVCLDSNRLTHIPRWVLNCGHLNVLSFNFNRLRQIPLILNPYPLSEKFYAYIEKITAIYNRFSFFVITP